MKNATLRRSSFVHDERGVATLEWVMIAGVVVLAAIGITTYMMNGANDLAEGIVGQMEKATPPK